VALDPPAGTGTSWTQKGLGPQIRLLIVVELSIRGILQHHLPAFLQRHRLPLYRHAAAYALASCKTAARGAHVRRCPQGHVEGVWYNSCRHRSCPQCGRLDATRWLQSRLRTLLPCAHHHLVFTLPSDLDELWRYNTKLLTELLFETVQWCLTRMLEDPRYLGAKPGVLAVLHTWGRTLSLHPHLHCLVTAGGTDSHRRWRSPRRSILVPCRPLGELFRGRFLAKLETLIRRGKLRLPPDKQPVDALFTLARAAGKKWTPRVEHRYEHGRGVIDYLARYVRGGPFRNSSLIACDDHRVRFHYGNWRRRDERGRPSPDVLTLSVDDFLSRLLLHVPQPHTRTVRGWGLYAHNQHQLLEQARQQIPEPTDPAALRPVPPRSWGSSMHCPACGQRLVVIRLPNAGRSPPTASLSA
jgi:hypothetical protein